MTTQQLKTFIYVAENLNFARAAELLNITQSAVSRQIHALEEELGASLFHRTTRTVTLTPAGLSFLEDAKHIMARIKLAASKIQHHTDSQVQVLSVGCENEAYLDLLSEILNVCRKQIPAFHPFLRLISHRSLLNLFYQGEIELIFGFRDDVPLRNDIVYQELTRVPLCCVLPASHPLTAKASLSKQDLLSEPLILSSSYTVPAKAAEFQHQIALQLPPESVHICENIQMLLTLVRAGYGYSILPESRFNSTGLQYIPLKKMDALSYGIFYKNGNSNPLLRKVAVAVLSYSKLPA